MIRLIPLLMTLITGCVSITDEDIARGKDICSCRGGLVMIESYPLTDRYYCGNWRYYDNPKTWRSCDVEDE